MTQKTREIYFYTRVSTVGQSVARQIQNFQSHDGYDPSRVYVDKVQGNIKFLARPEAAKLFDQLTSQAGIKTVVVDSIDRLGRSLIDILNTIQVFTKNGISLESKKEGLTTLLDDGTENPTAKLVTAIMGSISEMDRSRIRERCFEGIQIAKARGKYKGRKIGSVQTTQKLLERHQDVVKKLEKGLTVREISAITGKSTATVMKVKRVVC